MFTDMNCLVVGGAGFIGSHLCERLVDKNEVVSLDNYSTGKEENHILGVQYIHAESKDIEFVPAPDVVYHLGEYARVLPSFDDIDKVAEWNVVGTIRVLEYCRKNKVKLVYAGSSTKFGDAESPYSFFKSQNTELIKKYGEWFGLDYAIAYFYNVYGKRENGTLIQNFIEAGVLKVNAPGTQKRIFTHVDDIVDGLVLIGEKGHGEYCLGSEEEYTVLEVAQIFGKPIEMQGTKKGDRNYSTIDLTRAYELGWKAKKNLKDYVRHNL